MTSQSYSYQPRAHPTDKPAFIMAATGKTVSFGMLEDRANQGAHLLRAQGIKQGDHIAILMENRREMLEVCFAADRAGVYYTTISTHLNTAEIEYILADCYARFLIASDRFLDILPDMASVRDGQCKVMVVGDRTDPYPDWHTETARHGFVAQIL
jgi:long-chain acyl-CoA synthetase